MESYLVLIQILIWGSLAKTVAKPIRDLSETGTKSSRQAALGPLPTAALLGIQLLTTNPTTTPHIQQRRTASIASIRGDRLAIVRLAHILTVLDTLSSIAIRQHYPCFWPSLSAPTFHR